jgi:LuxR family maltose regulon positive regulatory protein
MSLAVKSGRSFSGKRLVRRGRLLAKLARDPTIPLVAIIAPAGYGKTSLLLEWTAEEQRSSAWISLESWHNDPIQLTRAILAALAEVEPLEESLAEVLACLSTLDLPPREPGLGPSPAVLSTLSAAVERRRVPFLLILDDAHIIDSPGALRVLAILVEHLPSGSQLVLASRTLPALPFGRLRAHRALLELGIEEMAMTRTEAASLLSGAGLRIGKADVSALVERTEGWPAGLYLAALSARDRPSPEADLARLAGSDHPLADYMRDEFLAQLSAEQHEFLLDSSILEQLSGPLCDATLQRSNSGPLLEDLARGNLPLGPIDRGHEWFRCHQLLREALLAELRHTRPRCYCALHLRACEWHSEHGQLDCAIEHAIAAGAASTAGDLLWRNLPRYLNEGRNGEVQRWLHCFSTEDISTHASLALTAAHSALALGDLREAEHWGLLGAGALARSANISMTASLPAGVAVIEAVASRQGLVPMANHAAEAYDREDQDSPWRSIFCLLRGVADHLTGDRAHAREHLEDGIHRSAVAAPNVETLCLSQLAMIAVEEGDWDQGVDLIARAVHQVERHSLASYPASALTFAVSADVRSHAGHVDEGKRDARRAAHLLARLSNFIPWYEAETRIVLARAALRLADVGEARALLAEASQLARRVPDAIVFEGWLDDTWGLIDSAATSALAGPAALTMAELRILRFLPTHLSFREIGVRLHVSTNTVKTQAHAVYRKLDVRSRSEAVSRAAEIGLLEG